MLVGLAGALAGYDGSFDFKSGVEYPSNVPYVAMRVMLATFGVGMVPLGWYTAVELGMSQWACHLVALMVLLGASLNSMVIGHGALMLGAQISAGCVFLVLFSSTRCSCSSHSFPCSA
jgi:dolichyl-phosphate-mannose--protein O-mannosyl transferase